MQNMASPPLPHPLKETETPNSHVIYLFLVPTFSVALLDFFLLLETAFQMLW